MTDNDDLDKPIWGARAFGEVLGKAEKHVQNMLDHGTLDATQIGRRWVSTKRRLLGPIVTPKFRPEGFRRDPTGEQVFNGGQNDPDQK
jgi:hypothetical protein